MKMNDQGTNRCGRPGREGVQVLGKRKLEWLWRPLLNQFTQHSTKLVQSRGDEGFDHVYRVQ